MTGAVPTFYDGLAVGIFIGGFLAYAIYFALEALGTRANRARARARDFPQPRGLEGQQVSAGISESKGGDPRNNADDAHATFMEMDEREWLGLLGSLIGGGALAPPEQEGLERALKDRDRFQTRRDS